MDIIKHSDLELFKNQTSLSHMSAFQEPYTQYKRSTVQYRIIFALLTLLFAVLQYVVWTRGMSWNLTFIFASFGQAKALLYTICSTIMGISAYLSLTLKAESEAAAHLLKWTKKQIHSTYRTHKLRYNLQAYHAFGEKWRQNQAFKERYKSVLSQTGVLHEETEHLLERIKKSDMVDPMLKERLMNQALLEFKEKLESILNDFQTLSPANLLTH